jgi:formylglycine-generating enzyme required for sulfatase activity
MPDDPLPSHFKGSDRPIEWISWSSAMDFCHKLTERERAGGRLPEGYEYTLPTEAQWEYACRAGTTGSFAGDLDAMAWYEKNSGLQTHPVGQKQPNAWGLYDMHGNVWEWCLDVYAGYPGGQVTDPRPDNTGPNASAPRMVRGGSAGASAGQCRSAERYRNGISYTSAAVGFRVALVPEFVASATREPAGGKANNRP